MCFLIDKNGFLYSVYFKLDLKTEGKECTKEIAILLYQKAGVA